jgi:hypothetical protein
MDPATMMALGSAAGGALSGLFGGGGSTQKSGPPKYVKQNQKKLYGQADTAYNTAVANAPTDFYAGMDPTTKAGIYGSQGYATGAGQRVANLVQGSAQPAITGGEAGALGSSASLLQASLADPTHANIASATQYADNPWVQDTIDAALRDSTRQLTEQDLPSLDRGAVAGGNTNSSRTGAQAAILQRGYMDRAGDISSALRSGLYTNGLSLAENARQANMGGLGVAGGLFSGVYGRGLDAANQGQTMNYNNYDAQIKGGQLLQQDAQGEINGQIAQNQYGLDLLGKKAGVTGLNSVSPGTNTTVQGPSGAMGAVQGAVGGGAAGLGLYKAYDQIQNPSKYSPYGGYAI